MFMLPFVTLAACIQHILWPGTMPEIPPSLKPRKLSIVSPLGARVVKPTWLQRRCLACGHLALCSTAFLQRPALGEKESAGCFQGCSLTRFV